MGRRALIGACLAAGAAWLAGCVLAAAGAGAGGAVYLTSRGAESVVPASVEATFEAAAGTFSEYGIERTSYTEEDDGAKRKLEGKSREPEADVSVEIERTDGGTTRVEVTARTSPVTWDKDYARKILKRIVERAG